MYKHFFKRILDILFGLIGLPFFCIVFIVLGPLIYITDKGPVFYNATRLGKNGKAFCMYKFRSMKVNAPDIRNADGSTFNGDNDSRVTPIGRFMRKTSLDEIPQVLNVLKGDMSIIGPRPTIPSETFSYQDLDEKQKKRYQVRPGITGYSQAYYRNSISQNEKFLNDSYYVDHVSFLFDLRVFFQTIKSVLLRKNIYVSVAMPTDSQEEIKGEESINNRSFNSSTSSDSKG